MSMSFECPKCGRACEQQYCPACDSEFDRDGLRSFDDTLVDMDEEEAVGQDEAAPNDALPENEEDWAE
ncbi:MAG: hypothetical protein SGJ19_14605 [Planctomycetia bacterium]|nr:hypothetical protein [Planctomycetia bacterium]